MYESILYFKVVKFLILITFYSGTPGSGKSYHIAHLIIFTLRTLKKNVISTVNVDTDIISKHGRKKLGDFVYKNILELTPKFLYEYAIKNHKKGKEGQTLLIIDECQIIFNPREYQRTDRKDWILFFTKHRHLGYNIILSSQFDRLIDRQVRSLFEYEIKHRKANNLGLLCFLPFTFFVCIEYWYGVRIVISRSFMLYRKKVASIYDSYTMYDDFEKEFNYVLTDKKGNKGDRVNKDNVNIKDIKDTKDVKYNKDTKDVEDVKYNKDVKDNFKKDNVVLLNQELNQEQEQIQVINYIRDYENDLLNSDEQLRVQILYEHEQLQVTDEQVQVTDEQAQVTVTDEQFKCDRVDSTFYDDFIRLDSDTETGVGGPRRSGREEQDIEYENVESIQNITTSEIQSLDDFLESSLEYYDLILSDNYKSNKISDKISNNIFNRLLSKINKFFNSSITTMELSEIKD